MHAFSIDALEHRRLLAFSVGGAGFDYGTASALSSDGGVIVAGLFSGTANFDPTGAAGAAAVLTSVGASDVFVARYDTLERLQWVRQFGGVEGRFEIDFDDLDRAVDVAINPRRAGGEFFVNGVSPNPLDAGEYVTSLVTHTDGSIYLTGGFRGRVDFDPGAARRFLTSGDREFYDCFVMKLTPAGNLVWANQFGGRFTDIGNDIALDTNGNPYVTGLFTRIADFNPSRATFMVEASGRADAFVMKLSINGKLIWVAPIGGEETDRSLIDSGNGITVDAAGNPYVTGTFAGSGDFNPARGRQRDFLIEARDETDGFVMQLSTNGKLIWAQSFGGFEFDGGSAIELIGPGVAPDLIVGGYFEEDLPVTIGNTTTTLRATPIDAGDDPVDTDLIISRYSNNGTLEWVRQIGGGGYETLGGLATDANEFIYFTGGYWGTADFDPGAAQANLTSTRSPFGIADANERFDERDDSYDAYFASLNGAGAFRFARSFGGTQDDFGIGLSRVARGSGFPAVHVLTGRFGGTANLNPDGSLLRTARGRGDAYVSLFLEDGTLQ